MADLFNTGTSNGALPPVPGGYGNPAGMNNGLKPIDKSTQMPAFPAFGPVTPQSGLNSSPYSPANFSGLSTGMKPGDPNLSGNFLREFQRAYGKGTGDVLYQMMTQGLFNPQVASAYMNALQPGVQRGQADLLNAFGRSGNRFGSAAALGLGDYNSQVQLNEGQLLAGLYQNAQSNQLNMLGNTLGTLHTEEANNDSGWLSSLLGGLEIAGGLIGAPFTGGATLGLVGGGINTLLGGGGKGDKQTQSGLDGFKNLFGGNNANGIDMSGESLGLPGDRMIFNNLVNNLIGSAGSTWGGSDTSGSMDMPLF